MTQSLPAAKRNLNRDTARRRWLFYSAYGGAVASVATVTWAILCWRNVLDDWGPDYDLVPRLLLCLVAAITLGGCLWCFRYANDAGHCLFREEAVPIYVGSIAATLVTIIVADRLSRSWLLAPKICVMLPLTFGGILILFLASRIFQLHDLPTRQKYDRAGTEVDPLYRFGIIVLTSVVGIASVIGGFYMHLDRIGSWAPFVLGIIVATLFAQGFRLLFYEAAIKRPLPSTRPSIPLPSGPAAPLRNHNVRAPVVLTK